MSISCIYTNTHDAINTVNAINQLWTGSDIVCDSFAECQSDILRCDPFLNCNISCHSSSACKSANITCPKNAHCIVDCTDPGADSCRSMTINAIESTSLTWNFPIGGVSDACDSSIVYCPVNGHLGDVSCTITGFHENSIPRGIQVR